MILQTTEQSGISLKRITLVTPAFGASIESFSIKIPRNVESMVHQCRHCYVADLIINNEMDYCCFVGRKYFCHLRISETYLSIYHTTRYCKQNIYKSFTLFFNKQHNWVPFLSSMQALRKSSQQRPTQIDPDFPWNRVLGSFLRSFNNALGF